MSDLQQVEGEELSEMVYRQALDRIAALMGCTEDSPEERELIHWAEIADRYERNHNLS